MDTTPTRPVPGDLPAVWRQRAQFLSDFGDPTTARLWQLAAAELERALEAVGAETLSLAEAARVTGYTPDHLSRLITRGSIPNAGRRGAPRIGRADLPQKNPHAAPGRSRGGAGGGRDRGVAAERVGARPRPPGLTETARPARGRAVAFRGHVLRWELRRTAPEQERRASD